MQILTISVKVEANKIVVQFRKMVYSNAVTMKLLVACVVLGLGLKIEAFGWRLFDHHDSISSNNDYSETSDEYTEEEVSSEEFIHNINLATPEECARECQDGEKPKTCYYKFTVEYYATMTASCQLCRTNVTTRLTDECQCIQGDGFEKAGIITANRMYPGPAIIICKYDNVVVDVENLVAGNAITIHWHGIYQQGYQYADGIPYVTQCPIVEGTTFRYQWKANNVGTHFWHAHTGLHKGEGLMGPLIVREPKTIELNSNLWDFDNIDNIIYLTDWFHSSSAEHFPGTLKRDPRQWPDNLLINGMGQWTHSVNGTVTRTTTPLATFPVKQGSRHRFRIINACSLACPVIMTIQEHNLTIIATDGEPLIPVNVTSITSFSAERYDFIINADKNVGSYWIQFRGIGECNVLKTQQLAVLRYESASNEPKLEAPSYDVGLNAGVILNQLNVHCDDASNVPDVVCISQLKSAKPVPEELLKTEPDVQLYLGFSFYEYLRPDIFKPRTYKTFLVAINEVVAYVGNITNVFPPSPLISQRDDIPDEQICSVNNIPSTCKGPEPCPCVHVEDIPLNSVVELVLVDEIKVEDLSHPFHLHGHPFYVVGGGSSEKYNVSSFDLSIIKDLDDKGLIKRELKNPPAKDTFAIPNNGFTIIRFLANNPGYWLFHCHFEFHLAVGMVTVFHIGEPEDLPPVPEGFPKCGNYVRPILKEF